MNTGFYKSLHREKNKQNKTVWHELEMLDLLLTKLRNSQIWLVKICWFTFYNSNFDNSTSYNVYIKALILISYHFYNPT